MQQQEEESHSSFLFRNLIKGLLWFAVIITAFILLEGEIKIYEDQINKIGNNEPLLFGIFTLSEIVFGILPPELFMLIWQTKGIISEYVVNLSILTMISYGAGVLGYFIGKNFSKTELYQTRIREKYLKQYEGKLKKFGGYLVFVGAVTPVPFSATCMLAGSVNMSFKSFLLICITRVLRFAVYGWLVWTAPNLFN